MFIQRSIYFRNIRYTRNQYSTKAQSVRIVEVGPRDGLQNETTIVPSDAKINFINKLSSTGLKTIEVTSFVSSKWVPQMADNAKVFSSITKNSNISYPVLVPNLIGLNSALSVGVEEIAVLGSASDTFSRKNVNCSANEALNRIKVITDKAKENKLRIRGYVSCVVGCPYEGSIKPIEVTKMVSKLLEFGCYEISLGDTIGVGTKSTISAVLKDVLSVVTANKLAIHCHDTYGQALSNICTALEYGVNTIDSSTSGLGGCPYAKGASGNVATEDLIYMLHGMGVQTGVDLLKVIEAGNYICDVLNKSTRSKVSMATHNKL